MPPTDVEAEAESRRLRRVEGVLELRLAAFIAPSWIPRTVILTTRLSRRDAERILAAFDPPATGGGRGESD